MDSIFNFCNWRAEAGVVRKTLADWQFNDSSGSVARAFEGGIGLAHAPAYRFACFGELTMVVQPVGPTEPGRVLRPEGQNRKAARGLPDPRTAWAMLSWFGIAAVFIGAFDILLAWLPLQSGNPAWEFGIINLTIWSLPFPTTGLVLLLASGIVLESRWRVRAATVALLLLAVVILGLLALYGLSIPIALQGAPEAVQPNVRKSIVKTVVLGLSFPTLYILLAVTALRRRRSSGQ